MDRLFRPQLPCSKSIALRALASSLVSPGSTTIRGLDETLPKDVQVFLGALERIGGVRVDVRRRELTVHRGSALIAPDSALDMGDGATGGRFLVALATMFEGPTVIDGSPQLRRRPMGPLVLALRASGAQVDELGEPGQLPLRVHGSAPVPAEIRVSGDISSQFASALLIMSARFEGRVRVFVDGTLVSRPYWLLTKQVLEQLGHGVEVWEGGTRVLTRAMGEGVISVEPDASSAVAFWALGASTGLPVVVEGIGSTCQQPDLQFLRVLESMGSEVHWGENHTTVLGAGLRGTRVSLRDTPDLGPVLAALATRAEGTVDIVDAGALVFKESDRLRAMEVGLVQCGALVERTKDGLRVTGSRLRPATVATFGDHRIAMAFGVLSTFEPGIAVDDPAVVEKSFPNFWAELDRFRRTLTAT